MSSGEVFPIINCADLLRTRAFYQQVFSATQSYQSPEDGEPDFLTLQVGSGTIALGRGTETAMYGEKQLPASGHAVDLCIYVPDLDAVVTAALAEDTEIPVPPSDTPWGERVAYVRDPEGIMILVIEDQVPHVAAEAPG